MRGIVYLPALLISLSSSSWAAESTSDSGQTVLATAKFAGACGILGQMAGFQQSTKMAGGTEFLNRFMNTEAARLGWTLDQYLSNCDVVLTKYQAIYDAMDEGEKVQ